MWLRPHGCRFWASTAGKTSDAYLAQVAHENGMRLATFDAGIRDAVAELIARPSAERILGVATTLSR